MAPSKYASIITEGQQIVMVYRRQDGDISERRVKVEQVWTCANGTAFCGMCQLRNEHRTFNLANVLWAMVDDGAPLTTFANDTPPGMHIIGPYMGRTDSASRLAGWSD